MPSQYWVRSQGQVAGPFSKDQLLQMGATGSVQPDDEISADQQRWTPASKVKGLPTSQGMAPAPTAAQHPEQIAAGIAPEPADLYNQPGGRPATSPIRPAPKTGRGKLVAGILILVILAAAAGGVGYWLLNKAGGSGPMAYAPPGTMIMAHVDVAALVESALAEVGKVPDLAPAEQVSKIEGFARKVRSVDVYAVVRGTQKPPLVLVAVHGNITLADVKEAVKSIDPKAPELPLTSKGNGRYAIEGIPDEPFTVIFGSEAGDLPDDVVLVGSGSLLTDAGLKKLGTGDLKTLNALLTGVDRSAPIWGAGEIPAGLDPRAPKSFALHIDPRPKGDVLVKLTFHASETAEAISQLVKSPMTNPMSEEFAVEHAGPVLTIRMKKTDEGLFGKAAAVLVKARRIARRSMSAANLRSIGSAMSIYLTAKDGQAPPDLMTLKKTRMIQAEHFFSPSNPRGRRIDAAGNPIPPFDYVYLAAKKKNLPSKTIVAFEKPTLNQNEGTNVLYFDGSVKWLTMEQFRVQLEKSRKAMK